MKFWFEDKKINFQTLLERYESLRKETESHGEQIRLFEDFYEMKNVPKYVVTDVNTSSRGYYTSYNLIRSIINTMQSRIGAKTPKPMFLTDNANYETQKKTKMNDKIVNYHFKHGKIYEACKQAFKLANVCNLGAVKVLYDQKKRTFKYEPVHPLKIFVSSPKHGLSYRDEIFQEYYIPKSTIIGMYPKHKDAILQSEKVSYTPHQYSIEDDYTKERGVHVVEAWKANKKHCIFIPDVEGLILLEEDWNYDFIPFAFYRWETNTEGFFGQGLAEELTPIQQRVNYITRKIINSIDLVAGAKIFISGNIENHNRKLTNQIGAIYRYSGEQPPFESMFQGVPESYFKHLQDTIDLAFKQSGLSELTVQTRKPAGLNSGKALITYQDIETQRFASASRDYSKMFIELAEITYEIGVKNNAPMFSKISDKEKPYIDIYPTNMLSDHPSGRYDDLEKLINMGVVPAGQVTQLLNFPDLKSFETSESATIKATREILHKIVDAPEDKEVFEAPVMELDLTVQLETSKKTLADMLLMEAKEYQIRRIRKYITMIRNKINEKLPPPLPDVPSGAQPTQPAPPIQAGLPNN